MKNIRKILVALGILLCSVNMTYGVNAEEEIPELETIEEEAEVEGELEEELPSLVTIPNDPEDEVESSVLAARTRAVLPTRYDSRDYGYISSVKNQNPYGICWSFTANSLAETSLLMQGGGEEDFSELHTAYYFYNRTTDVLGLTAGDRNTPAPGCDYRNNGGNNLMAAFELSGWTGTESEADAPYSLMSQATPALAAQQEFSADYKLRDAYFIKASMDDLSQVKYAIMNYGAVGIMYYHDYDYYDGDTAAYCYGGDVTGATNHAVTVVGWDDAYAKSNFPEECGVTGDGAWIVKNSWGTSFGEDGYFYISYEDPTICNVYAMKFQGGDAYQYNYHYDGSSLPTAYSAGAGQSLANVYTACAGEANGEILNAVSFAMQSADVPYSIQIYRDLENAKDPESGMPMLEQELTGQTGYAGIYTVDLPNGVYVEPGCKFSIVITLPQGGAYYAEATKSLPWVSATAVTAAGQSFWKNSKGYWQDLNSSNISTRIKGFTDGARTAMPGTVIISSGLTENNTPYLNWESWEDADGYCIFRRAAGDGSYRIYQWVSDASVMEWIDENTESGVKYDYKIAPWKEVDGTTVIGQCGAWVSVTTDPDQPQITSLYNSADGITIKWNEVDGVTGYYIYRQTESGSFTKIATIKKNTALSYKDTEVNEESGKKYTYVVRSYIGSAMSSDASQKSIYRLKKPKLVSLTNQKSGITVKWEKVTGADGYYIYRKKSGVWTKVGTVKGETTVTFLDKDNVVTSGTTYVYTVKAFKNGSNSPYDASGIRLKRLDEPKLISIYNSASGITVKWNKVKGASGYYVYRKLSGGSWSRIATVKGNASVSYYDKSTALKSGKTYIYTVKSYYSSTKSSHSTAGASVPCLARPKLTHAYKSGAGIRVKWSEVTGAKGYYVYRKTSGTGWKKIAAVKGNTVWNYRDASSALKSGKTYIYTVRAYSGSALSAYDTKGKSAKR